MQPKILIKYAPRQNIHLLHAVAPFANVACP
jgi:hypothetical protein